jgi:hypothetical protein
MEDLIRIDHLKFDAVRARGGGGVYQFPGLTGIRPMGGPQFRDDKHPPGIIGLISYGKCFRHFRTFDFRTFDFRAFNFSVFNFRAFTAKYLDNACKIEYY